MGRRIFANLRRAMIFITAVHLPIAGMALLPILLGLPQLLFPMHVVLLELVIDPVCALVFEAEPSERDAMRRAPRNRDEPLFGLHQAVIAMAQGVSILAGVLGVYLWTLSAAGEPDARAAGFVALVTGIVVLALADSASSGRLFAPHRRIFWFISTCVVFVVALTLWVPPLASIFGFTAPSWSILLTAFTVGFATGVWPLAPSLLRSRSRSEVAA